MQCTEVAYFFAQFVFMKTRNWCGVAVLIRQGNLSWKNNSSIFYHPLAFWGPSSLLAVWAAPSAPADYSEIVLCAV